MSVTSNAGSPPDSVLDAFGALIYRIATDDAALGPAGWTPERTRAYWPVIDLAIKYADSTPN